MKIFYNILTVAKWFLCAKSYKNMLFCAENFVFVCK